MKIILTDTMIFVRDVQSEADVGEIPKERNPVSRMNEVYQGMIEYIGLMD
ncbi:hypothetical protein ACFL6N_04335 [Thermodesulfobacteriota bacterium]